MSTCDAHLMEDDWQEGFSCDLPAGHPGPHRNEGGVHEVNESIDQAGRYYTWVHEWQWNDERTD